MSGSIGASRIKHEAVQKTIDFYIENVLKGFEGFVSAKATGSTVNPAKPDHGDLDLAIHVAGTDIKEVKKAFKSYLESLPDDLIVPFASGRNKGKKVQMYGTIITCQVPIQGGFEGLSVQVDNNIVLTEKEQEYQKSFLDLSAAKQALLMGLARVILIEENPEKIFKKLGIKKLPELDKNQEFEFVLSGSGLTLRKVTLEDFKEISREVIWKSYDWSDVEKLLSSYDLSKDFDELLSDVANRVHSSRSRRRIQGIVNSMINVGSGEENTPKGDEKLRAIDAISSKLGTLEEVSENTNTVALYGGGFKPPHKAHFADAEKLASKADRLIIFIGPKVRPGVPITAEQSKKVWEIYKKYLSVPTEIRLSSSSPITDIYGLLEDPDLKGTKFIVGKSQGKDEDKKLAYYYKNQDKFPNVTVKTLPTITTREDEKLSASTLRQSIETLKKGNWIPKCLDRDDARKVLDILIEPLQQQVVEEEIKEALQKTLDQVSMISEDSSGTPIAFSTITSSENRSKLEKLYWKLEKELGEPFTIQFNHSFIWIQSDSQEAISNLYDRLWNEYSDRFSIHESRGGIEIRVLRQGPVVGPEEEQPGNYRTNGERDLCEAVDPNELQDSSFWTKNLASMIGFLKKKGLKLDPLPDIVLNKEEQDNGLLDKTGQYNPETNVLELFIAGRHPKDALRTAIHELYHVHQNHSGKIGNISTEKVTEDDALRELEGECFREGNLLYREWLESLGGYQD